jgi:hypothetical protein
MYLPAINCSNVVLPAAANMNTIREAPDKQVSFGGVLPAAAMMQVSNGWSS